MTSATMAATRTAIQITIHNPTDIILPLTVILPYNFSKSQKNFRNITRFSAGRLPKSLFVGYNQPVINGFQTNGELSPTENAVRAALDERKKSGLYRTLTLISSPQKKRVKVGNRKLLLFSSNSYLNLTCDPLIRLKTAAAVLRWGIGSGGSRLTTGTLSKSLGGEGGYVCGTNLLIDFLRNSARSFIYTTSQPPADIAAALAALKKLKKNPRTVSRLRKNVACFSEALKSHGILCPVESAVIAVPAGSEENAVRASEFLREKGFLIPAIRFPSVPRGQAILRVTLMSSHTRKEIEAAAAAIAEAVRFGSVSGK